MERRQDDRRGRRLQVHYWRPGSNNRATGFSTNISTGGVFIATHQPRPPGERLRLEISSGEQSFVAEGVVARVVRSPPAYRTVISSGMGVRFLPIDELVTELIPPPRATQPSPIETVPDSSFEVRFESRQQFLAAYHRDIRTGGLFVPTHAPASIGDKVDIHLVIVELGFQPISLEARVVQSFTTPADGSTTPLLTGMGVELLDLERSLDKLRALLERQAG